MVQKQIHITEKAYNQLNKIRGDYMSFTKTILYLIDERKKYIVLQLKYEAVCEENEELKTKLKRMKK